MTPIQKNVYRAVKLLVEARLLAQKQGAAFRAEGQLAIARSYDSFAYSHQDNVAGSSLGSEVHYLEGNPPYKSEITVSEEEIQKDMEYILRYLNAARPQDLARLTEEFILGS